MNKTFRVEFSATKIVEVTLNENDVERGETIDDAAESLARDNLFHMTHPDMVRVVNDWDVEVESITGPFERALKTA